MAKITVRKTKRGEWIAEAFNTRSTPTSSVRAVADTKFDATSRCRVLLGNYSPREMKES